MPGSASSSVVGSAGVRSGCRTGRNQTNGGKRIRERCYQRSYRSSSHSDPGGKILKRGLPLPGSRGRGSGERSAGRQRGRWMQHDANRVVHVGEPCALRIQGGSEEHCRCRERPRWGQLSHRTSRMQPGDGSLCNATGQRIIHCLRTPGQRQVQERSIHLLNGTKLLRALLTLNEVLHKPVIGRRIQLPVEEGWNQLLRSVTGQSSRPLARCSQNESGTFYGLDEA